MASKKFDNLGGVVLSHTSDGRRCLRSDKANKTLNVEEFQKQMADAGIYATTADAKALDEAPAAYKPMDEIVKLIEPTVDIKFFMKPKMNIKAAEDKRR